MFKFRKRYLESKKDFFADKARSLLQKHHHISLLEVNKYV